MFKTKKLCNGKMELVIISSCVFLIILAISTIIAYIKKTNITCLLILSLILAICFSIQTYKLLVLKILKVIINEYFEVPKKVLSNNSNYQEKLDKIDEYVEYYKKIFSKSDLNKINFTRELVTQNIKDKNSIKDANHVTYTS